MDNQSYVYIVASSKNGTLYIGVTSDLMGRIYQHKNNLIPGFTAKYSCHILVHYEIFDSIEQAIIREKQLKRWNRQWKIRLIEQTNPTWRDLSEDF